MMILADKLFKLFNCAFRITLVVIGSMVHPSGTVAQAQPGIFNVVFILADDLGWRDLGCYGNSFNETPAIDALAADGVRFTQAYASAPICSPTRASILTGRYPAAVKITDFIPGHQNYHGIRSDQRLIGPDFYHQLPHEETTIAEVLRQRGYATASIGKWHLGGEGSLPPDHGFQLSRGGTHRGFPPAYFFPYRRNDGLALDDLNQHGRVGEYLTDRLTEEALKFVKDNQSKPFFLYLSHYAVHTPMQAKDTLIRKYQNKEINFSDSIFTNPVYAAMLESLDQSVARVVQSLKELNLYNNTIIVFASDNGGLVGEAGAHTPPTSNAPLRSGKAFLYEGGVRVPLIIRWPGVTSSGSVSKQLTSSVDFYPTFLDMLGIDHDRSTVDGASLANHLRTQTVEDQTIFWHYPHYHRQGSRPAGAVRQGRWKYIEHYEDHQVELYDMEQDLAEKTNLSEQYPTIVEAMRTQLSGWRAQVGAVMPRLNPVYFQPYTKPPK